jgi:hypothetical protein
MTIIFLVLVAYSVYAQSPEWKGKIEYENGVKVIKNPKEPLYGGDVFKLEEELTIGVAEGDDEYSFIRLWYLAVDEDENIYAMDQGATQVKVYNTNGQFLRSIGRKGQGPGELDNPNMIFITNQDQLIVEDFIRNLTYYSLAGDFIKSTFTSSIFPVAIGVFPNGQIIAITNEQNPDKHGKNVGLYNNDLGLIKMQAHFPEPKPDPGIIRIFQPKISWVITSDGELVLSFKENYEIHIFNEKGALIKKILKDYKPVKVTQEDIDKGLGELAVGKKIEAPKNHPAIQSILADDQGRIIVKTYEKVEEGLSSYEVINSEGMYMGKISLGGNVQVIKNNKLYTVEEDEEGYQYIKRYKVTWNY